MSSSLSLPSAIDAAELETLEAFAVEIARQTGHQLLDRFGQQIAVEYKAEGGRSPVTPADRDAEAFLRDAIRARYPDHGILGEEGEDLEADAGEFVWVLDPL